MEGLTTLALSLAVLLGAPPAPVSQAAAAATPWQGPAAPPPADPWFGDDKLRHLTMSVSATSFAFAAARALGAGEAAAPAAAAAAFAAGIGKEIADVRAGRGFSLRDLVWDVAGVAAGYVLARNVR